MRIPSRPPEIPERPTAASARSDSRGSWVNPGRTDSAAKSSARTIAMKGNLAHPALRRWTPGFKLRTSDPESFAAAFRLASRPVISFDPSSPIYIIGASAPRTEEERTAGRRSQSIGSIVGGSRPLGQLLKDMELVSEGQIQEALAIQRKKGGAIGDVLVELAYITPQELLLALGSQRGMEVVALDELELPSDVTDKVPATLAKSFKVVPIKWDPATKNLTVAMANPHDINILDDLRYTLHCEVVGAVASHEAVDRALQKYYAHEAQSLNQVLTELGEGDLKFEELKDAVRKKGAAYNVDEMINAAPVVKLLNLILVTAIKAQSSDIHFEPFENEFKVRYRVDGVLYEMEAPPLHLALPLISRVKVLSNLDISETGLPQYGRILLSVGGRPVDLRISTLPTIFGESVVMRVLDRSVVKLDLDNVGLRDDEMKMLKDLINLPHGIIIVTGPTGSGKTTTLYSCLNYANDIRWKIITTEDPE